MIRWLKRRKERRKPRRYRDEIRHNQRDIDRMLTLAAAEDPTTYMAPPARWEDGT